MVELVDTFEIDKNEIQSFSFDQELTARLGAANERWLERQSLLLAHATTQLAKRNSLAGGENLALYCALKIANHDQEVSDLAHGSTSIARSFLNQIPPSRSLKQMPIAQAFWGALAIKAEGPVRVFASSLNAFATMTTQAELDIHDGACDTALIVDVRENHVQAKLLRKGREQNISAQPCFISDFEFLSPLGSSLVQFSENLFSGRSGLSNLEGRYGAEFPIQAVGLIPELDGERRPLKVCEDLVEKILRRHREKKIDGVIFCIPNEDEAGRRTPPEDSDEQIQTLQALIQRESGFDVDSTEIISIHEGCVSGLNALSMAAQRIRTHRWKRALVIGADLRCSPIDLLRFYAIGALTLARAPQASCPFSSERRGFVRSQGAAAFLLESETASAWGEIKGFAQTSDAWRLTEARPDCVGATRAIYRALGLANLDVKAIDCVSAHATSTLIGDALEARALHAAFGDLTARLPVTALKSQIGHCGQASGFLQVIAALMMLKEQRLAPVINYQTPDPNCDLDFVTRSQPAQLSHILCNASAFGGQNAGLIIGKGN